MVINKKDFASTRRGAARRGGRPYHPAPWRPEGRRYISSSAWASLTIQPVEMRRLARMTPAEATQ